MNKDSSLFFYEPMQTGQPISLNFPVDTI